MLFAPSILWAYHFDYFITNNLISWTKEDHIIPHIDSKSYSNCLQFDEVSLVQIYLSTLQSFKHAIFQPSMINWWRQHVFLPISFSTLGANMFASPRQCSDWIILYLHFNSIRLHSLHCFKIRHIWVFSAISRSITEPIETFAVLRQLNDYLFFQPEGGHACQLFTKTYWRLV